MARNDVPKGPIRFHIHHVPSGRLLGTYMTSTQVHEAKEAFEREDPEGAARGDYRSTYSCDVPKVEPHRFELALLDGTFGPICSVCGLPVDFAPHPNREEAWQLFMENF
ncbi:MAG TPA: hypothetical protein VF984_03055 [Actinomycetota bacterium]